MQACAAAILLLLAADPASADLPPSPAAGAVGQKDEDAARTKKVKTKRKKKKPPAKDVSEPLVKAGLEARGSIAAGASSGRGTRRAPHALIESEVAVVPKLDLWLFGLELPARLTHTKTFFAPFDQTDAEIDLEAGLTRWKELRIFVVVGAELVSRSGWLDSYQPTEAGALLPTDRFGSFERRIGARLTSTPFAKNHARASYLYSIVDSMRDPAFDPVLRPNHLTPQDHDAHELAASWRYSARGFKVGAAARAFRRSWFFVFARDAGTGKTHAGAGGAPPNPLQALQGVEVEPQVELALWGGAIELEVEPSLGLVDDPFEGYLSSLDFGCAVAVALHLPFDVRARARLTSMLRLYGEGAYAEGSSHPPLDFGERRQDARVSAAIEVRRALGPGIDAFAELKAVARRTNFPDYVPEVFPSDQLYDVRRDTAQALVRTGVAFALP